LVCPPEATLDAYHILRCIPGGKDTYRIVKKTFEKAEEDRMHIVSLSTGILFDNEEEFTKLLQSYYGKGMIIIVVSGNILPTANLA
jgi:hypothetical protein